MKMMADEAKMKDELCRRLVSVCVWGGENYMMECECQESRCVEEEWGEECQQYSACDKHAQTHS